MEVYAAGFDMFPWNPPAVSPDGKRLFVLSENQTHDIARYDPVQQTLAPILPGVSAAFRGYSPDGKWIAYTALPDSSGLAVRILPPGGKPGKILLAPVDGGRPQVLFGNEPTAEDSPTFSPDGQVMGFGRTWLDAQGNTIDGSTCLMDRQTGKITRLSEADDDIRSPVWSPDGSRMAAPSDDGAVKLFDPRSRT